jgi:hypothetical protein
MEQRLTTGCGRTGHRGEGSTRASCSNADRLLGGHSHVSRATFLEAAGDEKRPISIRPSQPRWNQAVAAHAYFNAELLQVAHRMSLPGTRLAITTKPCEGLSMKTRPPQPLSKADAVPTRPQCGHSSATAHLVGGASGKAIVVASMAAN